VSTVLVALSHPDDEIGCVGTIAAHRARRDRVVLLWLTRGEMTDIYGDLELDQVAARRMDQGREAARILGAEARFLDFHDTGIEATPDAARSLARVLARIRPDVVVTWGQAWARGMRHPDHQATGDVVRAAVTHARLRRVVAPAAPHRDPSPIFTLRAEHSTLPVRAVDVSAHMDVIVEVARYYHGHVGWPDEAWLVDRLRQAGARWGVDAAEEFDAWESPAGLGTGLL
jgi:N-acetylglucosamine malate deacetylase 1